MKNKKNICFYAYNKNNIHIFALIICRKGINRTDMRDFNYEKLKAFAIPIDIVLLIVQIHEYKGRQELFATQQPERLSTLLTVAKIQSTEASNKIEGIYTSNSRLHKLMEESTTPHNRDEEEIAGYRDVLDTIHASYEYIPLTKNTILQLHKELYKYSQGGNAGRWKQVDNIIEEIDTLGNKSVRFTPTTAFEVDDSIISLCESYSNAINSGSEPLMSIFTFVLDFLCIHPFADDNGRMSRLLTLLLMYRSGYFVGKYISIEHIIEKTKESYYGTLKESSQSWHENENDTFPFIRYSLGVILSTYLDFEERVIETTIRKMTKRDQIREVFNYKLGKITKSDIRLSCPNVSEVLIEKTLKIMLDNSEIEKDGAGRTTGYFKL